VSTVVEKPTIAQTAYFTIDSIVFAGAQLLLTAHFMRPIANVVLVFLIFACVLGYACYVVLFFYYLSAMLKILQAHMTMIEASGIDALSTPTRRKIEMLIHLRCCGIAVFFVIVLSTLLSMNDFLPFWLVYVFVAPIVAALYGFICWVCRIRSKMVAIYGAEQDSYAVDDKNPPTKWAPGIPLPPMPRVGYCHRQIHPGDTE
jgi:hypothetical protein